MASGVTLRKSARDGPLISLVPMIDVLLILLVFFMVTSTYLNLDMIPAVRPADQPNGGAEQAGTQGTLMIRLSSDGAPVIRGQAVSLDRLTDLLAQRLAEEPLTQVLVLPSGSASTQALISVMDSATRAGVVRLRVVRLEPRP